MSDLTIWGNALSQPTRSVLTFCRLSEIPFTYRVMEVAAREYLGEEFTRINPHQEMPAIVHNGFNLWESPSIVAYLADAYNVDNSWYPKDIQIRARINSYLHWHHQNVRDALTPYIRAKFVRTKLLGLPELTEAEEAPYKAKLAQWYESFTWLLSDTHYVARTANATIADVFAYNEIVSAHTLLDLDSHPTIKAWFLEIGANPIVQEYTAAGQEIVKAILAKTA